MKLVKESISFKRGLDPKRSLGLGSYELTKQWLEESKWGADFKMDPDGWIEISSTSEAQSYAQLFNPENEFEIPPDYVKFDVSSRIINSLSSKHDLIRNVPIDFLYKHQRKPEWMSLRTQLSLEVMKLYKIYDEGKKKEAKELLAKMIEKHGYWPVRTRNVTPFLEEFGFASSQFESISFQRGLDPNRSLGLGKFREKTKQEYKDELSRYLRPYLDNNTSSPVIISAFRSLENGKVEEIISLMIWANDFILKDPQHKKIFIKGIKDWFSQNTNRRVTSIQKHRNGYYDVNSQKYNENS